MKENKVISFMKDKGFYIALAVCIVGASAAAWSTANRTLDSIDESNRKIVDRNVSGEDKKWGYSELQPEKDPAISRPVAGDSARTKKPSPSSSSAPAPSSPSCSSSALGRESASPSSVPVQQPLAYTPPVALVEMLNPYSGGQLVKNQTLGVWRTHDGVDLKGKKGDKVLCVATGTVVSVVADPLWGGTVHVQHPDGHISIYCGVSVDAAVKKDAALQAGQAIGTLDQIPAEISMEPHLHFAMMKDGQYIDPALLIQLG